MPRVSTCLRLVSWDLEREMLSTCCVDRSPDQWIPSAGDLEVRNRCLVQETGLRESSGAPSLRGESTKSPSCLVSV